MNMVSKKYPHNTPTTKEAYFYREIFHQHFPHETYAKTVLKWIPKWQENEDPSGRANVAHVNGDMAAKIKKVV